jgi:hypothetical protein
MCGRSEITSGDLMLFKKHAYTAVFIQWKAKITLFTLKKRSFFCFSIQFSYLSGVIINHHIGPSTSAVEITTIISITTR